MDDVTNPMIGTYHIGVFHCRNAPEMNQSDTQYVYRCHFDTSGAFDQMLLNEGAPSLLTEAPTALDTPDSTARTNHRKALHGVFGLCNAPEHTVRLIFLLRPIRLTDSPSQTNVPSIFKENVERSDGGQGVCWTQESVAISPFYEIRYFDMAYAVCNHIRRADMSSRTESSPAHSSI
ncbi:hypothetical protein BDV93DRAFT_565113 [Ceratobasidium sp. AG-I]|nr:hypothetical protein BDV93DRAFT_565113 [Ceratobasidium sp. AG-I]